MFVTSKQLGRIPIEDTPRKPKGGFHDNTLLYIGLDIHKKVIAYCIKTIDGRLVRQGVIEASRKALDEWMQ